MIIAISGKAQSGKDTVCKMIQYCIAYHNSKAMCTQPYSVDGLQTYSTARLERNSKFFKFSFAEFLKQGAAGILDINREAFEDIDFKNSEIPWIKDKEKPITVRQFLQRFGTALRREFSEYFWADSILRFKSTLGSIIIPDLRYKTELEAIKNKDPENIIIRVNRPGVQLMDHPSETELDDYKGWDYVIENDGTLESLLYKVRDFCKAFSLI